MEKSVCINSGEARFYKRKGTIKRNCTKEKLYRIELPTNSWLVETSLLYLGKKLEAGFETMILTVRVNKVLERFFDCLRMHYGLQTAISVENTRPGRN